MGMVAVLCCKVSLWCSACYELWIKKNSFGTQFEAKQLSGYKKMYVVSLARGQYLILPNHTARDGDKISIPFSLRFSFAAILDMTMSPYEITVGRYFSFPPV